MTAFADRIAYYAREERRKFEHLKEVQRKALVLGYLSGVGIHKLANWCAAFVSHVVRTAAPAGMDVPQSAGARAWGRKAQQLGWLEVSALPPKPGDVWVFWRVAPDAWQGHIGIVVALDGDHVTLLEGNVQNAQGRRVVGFRRYPLANPARRLQAWRNPE